MGSQQFFFFFFFQLLDEGVSDTIWAWTSRRSPEEKKKGCIYTFVHGPLASAGGTDTAAATATVTSKAPAGTSTGTSSSAARGRAQLEYREVVGGVVVLGFAVFGLLIV